MITSTLIDGPIEVLTKHERIFPAPLSSLPVTLSQMATALEVKSSIPCSLDPTARPQNSSEESPDSTHMRNFR